MSKDLTGTTLGKYQLIERLGRGGMADVYRAFQPIMERYVAVKVMHTHLTEDEDFITRFKREAQIVGSLRHPHIVQVIDFDIHEGEYYMVMEYVQGDTLKSMLKRRGAIPVNEALDITAKLADALAYAHGKGMIHRDIKPANVLMDAKGSPILSDFGIARLSDLSGLTSTGMTVGTPSYMSPESGRGDKVDERTDIYSLGIVLYEMLTGTVPYDADTPYAVILKHINDPLPAPRQFGAALPAFVEKVVLKALAKNREDRYQTAAEFRTAIDKAMEQLQSEPIGSNAVTGAAATAVGTQIAQRTTPVASQRIPMAGLAAVAAIVIIGIAFLVLSRPSNTPPVALSSTTTALPQTPTTVTVIAAVTTDEVPAATNTSAATNTPEPIATDVVVSSPTPASKYAAIAAEVLQHVIHYDASTALVKLEALLKDDPESYDLIVLRGITYLEMGSENNNFSKALADAETAMDIDPERPEAYILLGAYHQFGIQYDGSDETVAGMRKAIEYYNQAEQKGNDNYSLYWLRARANSEINNYIGSDNNVPASAIIADLEKANQLNPPDYRFYNFQGDFYASNKMYDEALKSFERSLELEPSPYQHRAIAEMHIIKGQPELALSYYKDEIVENRNSNPEYIAQGAYIAWRSNDLELAKEWADLALSLDPKLAAATYVKGLMAFGDKQYEQALKYFDQVAQADRDSYSYPFLNVYYGHHIQNERGYTLAELGRTDEAIKAFSASIEDNPYWVEALIERAKLYRTQGKIEEARADLRNAFEITSSDEDNTRRNIIVQLLRELNEISPEASPTP